MKEYAWFTLDEFKDLKIVESNRVFFEVGNDSSQVIKEQIYEK